MTCSSGEDSDCLAGERPSSSEAGPDGGWTSKNRGTNSKMCNVGPWGTIAKLVNRTSTTMVYDTYNWFINQLIAGGPHIVGVKCGTFGGQDCKAIIRYR